MSKLKKWHDLCNAGKTLKPVGYKGIDESIEWWK